MHAVLFQLTELFWTIWTLAAASEKPPQTSNIPWGQTRQDLSLTTARWSPELTTEPERVHLWRDFLSAGTAGSPPLMNCRSVHSDSGKDWCFFLEIESSWSTFWCTLPPCHSSLCCLWLPSADLVVESDWIAGTDPGGNAETNQGGHLDSSRP